MGKTERQIIETCKKRGQPLPEALQNAPVLYSGLDEYYSAFWRLHTDRQIGMGIGQIPWTSMVNYADREEMDAEEFLRFETLIRAMDDAYLEHAAKPKDNAGG
jgi:hypothetical protein